jgi:enoyl-CoA hydratase
LLTVELYQLPIFRTTAEEEVEMTYSNIKVDKAGAIATITFNRPKAMNALNGALLEELSDALDQVSADAGVGVIVLTGAGDKAFVAGADITELSVLSPLQAKAFIQKGQGVISKLGEMPVPAIAAVNGYALGGGMEMALGCDFIYASDKAAFGLPEITLGLIPGFGGTQRLARLIGPNQARELIFTGRMMKAEEALRLGIVNKVIAAEELMSEVMAVAGGIASKGKVALRAAKQALGYGLNVDLPSGLRIEQDAFAICMSSSDAKEGTQAFIDKRKPEFKSRLDD